jgi:hypothetical protein
MTVDPGGLLLVLSEPFGLRYLAEPAPSPG